MKTLTRHLLSTRALAVAGVTALLASAATPAHAILLNATQTLPNLTSGLNQFGTPSSGITPIDLYTGTDGLASDSVNQVDLGVFSFTGYTASTLPSLVGLQISLNLNNFNTNGSFLGDEFLTIDGVNTGIALNGFGNNNTTRTVTGVLSNTTNANTILSYLNGTTDYTSNSLVYNASSGTGNFLSAATENFTNTTNVSGDAVSTSNPAFSSFTTGTGQLVIGVLNTAASTNLSLQDPDENHEQSPDQFSLAGGTARLSIADYAIPFHPAQALGFILIALCIGLWYLPQTKVQFRRLLAPTA